MKNQYYYLLFAFLLACSTAKKKTSEVQSESNVVDKFADVQVLKFDVKSWDKLTLKQKTYAYYLSQAGLSGRDINYDQNNEHNLIFRSKFHTILENKANIPQKRELEILEIYIKRFYFSNGIHHHYSMEKLPMTISREVLETIAAAGKVKFTDQEMEILFNPELMDKRKVKDPNVDMVVASANNYYADGITQKMVEEFYASKIVKGDKKPIEYGLNSRLELKNGKIVENFYSSEGLYGKAIQQIIFNLKKAVEFTENEEQQKVLVALIRYYQTGNLKEWDAFNILWSTATKGDIDFINGFIETYGDALGMRANFESIVQIKDFDASEKMKKIAENAQWFEDNSPILSNHKKEKVVGVSYNVVEVLSESGDAAPSTAIGVNLPNNNWIRQEYGSKSVSLGNVIAAYEKAGSSEILKEFTHDELELSLAIKYGAIAGKTHTALHEVIGHASGKVNDGIGQPAETLKNYASTLEEARADLVGLYYILDPKLVELGAIESIDAGKAQYDAYIRNALIVQLNRLTIGQQLEEEHMQNRQLVASWVFEKGSANNVIKKVTKNGKTYYDIQDYEALRVLFGELLKEIQRIKSEGDYQAGKDLVEKYGVKVSLEMHKEVLQRIAPFQIAPYNGFVYPEFEVKRNDKNEIIEIKLVQPASFLDQMLRFDTQYGFLIPSK